MKGKERGKRRGEERMTHILVINQVSNIYKDAYRHTHTCTERESGSERLRERERETLLLCHFKLIEPCVWVWL